MSIPLRAGREFGSRDTVTSPGVIVVNESMAKRYWPDGKALGGRIRMGETLIEVVGIAADTKYASLTERPLPQLFYPLAAIGLYGVISYAVNQRTQEMGLRLALGASPGALLSMIVGQGMALTATGLGVGLVLALGAFGSIGAMRSLLPGISPLDPFTFISVPLTLTLISLVASWIPARRAGLVDPLVALRVD